jgi:hypothetical protein
MCAAVLLAAAPAMAKSKPHHGVQARPHYNYALAHPVREGFRERPRDRYTGREDFYATRESTYRESGPVVENLRGAFTGGVGYGADGGDAFIDGYGQTHFFVGSFRNLNRLPHGPYGPQRFAPGRRF